MRQAERTIEQLFPKKSEIGMLARSLDWSATSLGPVTDWPQSLKTAVSMCLHSPYPGVIWWGTELISFYNDACKSLLGTEKYRSAIGQAGSQGWSQIWPILAPQLARVLATGEGSEWEDQKFSLSSDDVYYGVCHSPIFDESDNVTGIFSVFTETGQPKEAEAQLRESRYFIAKIAETVPGILYVYDLIEQRNIYVNKQVMNLLGYSEEWVNEVSSNLILTLLHPDDLATSPDHISKVENARDGEVIELEYRMQHANGEWRWLQGREVVFSRTADGLPQEVLGIAMDITEHKNREIALQASEERFRLVTESVNGLVFDWDLEKGTVYRSEQLYDLIGVHPSEADSTASWWQERIHPEDMARISPTVPDLLASNKVVGAESELRDSQNQLRQQLAEIEAIYETAPIGLAVLDRDLRFLRINQRLAEINGLSVEAHIGRTVRELLPQLANTAEPLLHQVMEKGEPLLNVELNGETPAQPGVTRFWLEHFLPLRNGDEITGLSIVCEEITDAKQREAERLRIESALRESEARFRNMADYSPMMVWLTDARGYCTYLAKSWYEFTGQSQENGLGLGWLNAIHPEDLSKTKALFLDGNERQTPFRLEYRLRRHDGRYRWAIKAATPWFGPDGEFQGYIGSVVDISDRKEAEEALRESEEKFRQLAENIADMVFWIYDISIGGVIYVSSAYEKVWGLSVSSLLEDPEQWLEAIHPDDIETIRQTLKEKKSTGNYEQKYRILRRDGSLRWIHDRGFAILDSSGKPYRVVGIAEDITARINAETALKETSHRLNLALKSAPLSLFTQDRDLRYTWIYNPTHNYTIAQVIGRRDEKLTSKASAAELTRIKSQVLKTGSGARGEVKLVNADKVSYYDLTVEPLRDESDAIIGITCVAVDISERVKTEEALRQSEMRLKQLVELNLLGVMFWHIDGRVIDANDAFLNMIGYTRSELEAGILNWRAMTPPEQIRISESSIERMRRNASDSIEKEYIRKDEQKVPVLLGGVMFKDSHELGVSFVVDMTEQKQAEAELQQKASELKKLNSALKQTTDKLTQRNQELDRFVYTVSHDLKAPLRAIANLADWLAEDLHDKLDEDNLRQMQLLQNRVVRMVSLIDGLLVYSRIGRTEVATEDVNISQLIAEIIDSLAPPFTFRIGVEAELPNFLTRKLLLFQVLSNLISNAIKHNDKANGRIDISACFDGQVYRFSVADNGPGIEKENQERIFGIFQTLKSRDIQENTGIGLSIVKKIVETEGGSISLESEPGQGSIFSFTWPA